VFGTAPGFAKSNHDHLPLPGGKTVGATDDSELYRALDKLVPNFKHTLGRLAALDLYAAEVARVQAEGAKRAVAEWFKENV
jgi:hypothetical protein